ncbi:MAG TPA: DUF4157 domain-containing protein [Roseiflexaceae bacterium]|nr:DUF4157 domain-containing protein [Roseiflexaceae bacterium]
MSNRRTNDPRRQNQLRRKTDSERAPEPPAHPLLRLQRQIGNQQIARMLAQREDMDEIQTLRVQREDMDEIQPMRVQREDMDEIQASPEVGMEGGPVSSQTAQRIQSMRGGGAPLSESMRGSMEQSFGTSFDDVRVHNSGESASINRAISAKAFTTGSDIFLGDGASSGDSKLMAHELTHVVQQRSMSSSGPMSVGPADDHYEREADSMASSLSSAPAPAAQREADEQAAPPEATAPAQRAPEDEL